MFTEILSPFTTTFNASVVPTHNDLSGLQGGTTNEYYHLTSAELTVVQNTSGTNTGDQDLSGLVAKSTYDANTILYATTDNTPVALTVGEQTVVGRATGGAISALSIDSDLSSVSANDDTIPSAKATKAYVDDGTATLTNKTLTAPKFADLGYIADANGNEMIIFDTVASAVNELTIANGATGN